MVVVLWILAAATLVLGFFQTPIQLFLKSALGVQAPMEMAHHHWLPMATMVLAVAALTLTWFEFGRRNTPQVGFIEKMPAVARLFSQRWYLDHLYRWLLDKIVYQGIARLCTWNDRKVIDGALDGLGWTTIEFGQFLARLHTGLIQYRLMVMFAMVVLVLLYLGLNG